MYHIRYPLSFRQVEDILHERGIDICHKTVRFWVNRFGEKFVKKIRKNRADNNSNWQWHLDEFFVKINGERFYLWRVIDHEGEVLECYISKRRYKFSAKKLIIKTMKKHGVPHILTTDVKILTSPFDENVQCSVSKITQHCRNSRVIMLKFTTILTIKGILKPDRTTKQNVTLLWSSGFKIVRDEVCIFWRFETSSNLSDSTQKPLN